MNAEATKTSTQTSTPTDATKKAVSAALEQTRWWHESSNEYQRAMSTLRYEHERHHRGQVSTDDDVMAWSADLEAGKVETQEDLKVRAEIVRRIEAKQKQEQRDAKLAAIRDAIAERLRQAGHTVANADGRWWTVNGNSIDVEVDYVCDKSSWRHRETDKTYCTVGNYGDKTRFPEGKNGLNCEKIVAAIIGKLAAKKAAEENRLNKEQKHAAAKRLAAKLNAEAGVEAYSGLEGNEWGRLVLKLGSLNEEQARAMLAAAVACGAVKLAEVKNA